MRLIYCWLVTLRIILRYFLYRIGIGKRPNFTDRWPEVQLVYRQVTRMDNRIRLRGLEHYPGGHPAVYAGNHVKLDDSFYACYAVQEASNYTKRIRFVMRDNFFVGFPWNWLPVNMNEIAEMGGCYNISQDGVTLAQLRPLVDMLLEPDSFVIFPTGRRTRSGLWFEYPDDIPAPGSVSFFLAQAQRKNPDVPVPAVPVGRTYNPVTEVSTVMLGPPLYLEAGARRDAQRAMDDDFILAISELVEINMTHLLGGVLYLRCLHDLDAEVSMATLRTEVRAALDGLGADRPYDPIFESDFDGALNGTLAYFARCRMIRRGGDDVHCLREAILAVPPMEVSFRTENPVKFAVNQVVHLPDVVRALEHAVGV